MYDPIIDPTTRLIIDCDKIIQLSGDNNMDWMYDSNFLITARKWRTEKVE